MSVFCLFVFSGFFFFLQVDEVQTELTVSLEENLKIITKGFQFIILLLSSLSLLKLLISSSNTSNSSWRAFGQTQSLVEPCEEIKCRLPQVKQVVGPQGI